MKRVAFLVCSGIGYLIGHYFGAGAVAAYASILISYHLYLVFLVVSVEKETGLSLPIGQTILTHGACLALVVGIGVGRHYIPFFGIVGLFVPAIAPFEVTWLFSGQKKKKEIVEGQLAAAVAGVPSVPIEKIAEAPAPALIAVAVANEPSVPDPITVAVASELSVPEAITVTAPVVIETPAPIAVTSAPSAPYVPVAGYVITNSFTATPVNSATSAEGMKVSYSSTSYESDSTGDDYEDFILHMQSGKRPFRKPGVTVKQEFDLWLAHRTKTRQEKAAAAARTPTKTPVPVKVQV